MKTKSMNGVLPLAFGLAVVACVQAQPLLGAASQLDQAVGLLNDGQPGEARSLIATIDPADSSYAAGKAYDALCLYELNDKRKFLEAMESPEVRTAAIPTQAREELDYDQIDALLYYRKLDELIVRTGDFSKNHAGSARLPAVTEYRMAGLFERGMKQALEGAILTNTSESEAHWTDGDGNLKAFLLMASNYSGTNYQYLTNAVLGEQVWKARIILGDETNVLKELPLKAASDRERVRLFAVQLHQKLDPKDIDGNLLRMGKFITDYPLAKSRKRLEFDMASISFQRGEALCKEAVLREKAGDLSGGAALRSSAGGYFNYTRTLQAGVATNTTAGIEASDVEDLLEDNLYSYYLEKNFSQLATSAAAVKTNSIIGSQKWMLGKIYSGIALQAGSPPDLPGAAKELEDVLALGFNQRPDHNRLVLVAAKWRIQLAIQSADQARAAEIVRWVRDSNCTKNQRTAFTNTFSSLLDDSGNNSK